MYSGISRTQHYFFIERVDGDPVMTRDYFGISASSLKKMYHSHLRRLRDRTSKERDELGPEDYAAAGQALLEHVFEQGRERKAWQKAPLSGQLRLVRVDIERGVEGIGKRRSLITSREVSR